MDKRVLIALSQSNPAIQKGIETIQAKLQGKRINPRQIKELIQLLEAALDHPDKYPQIKAAAVKEGLIEAKDLPNQFVPQIIMSLLIVFYNLQEHNGSDQQTPNPLAQVQQEQAQPQMSQQMPRPPMPPQGQMPRPPMPQQMPQQMPPQGQPTAFAHGGLAVAAHKLAAMGRNGDNQLAHINPEEARMLKQAGGSGTINPRTGLHEYWFDFKPSDIFGAILPAVTDWILPSVSGVIEKALPVLGSTGSDIVGGAAIGALGSSLTGGNAIQGGIGGAMQGGLGNFVSDKISQGTTNPLLRGLSSVGTGALLGGASSALQGTNMLKGAGMGAAGGALTGAANYLAPATPTAMSTGLTSAAKTAGNQLVAGYNPSNALAAGAASGIGSYLSYKPSDAAVANTKAAPDASATPDTAPKKDWSTILTLGGLGLAGASLLGNNSSSAIPPAVAASLTPAQTEYLSRPSVAFDWGKLQADAIMNNMSVGQFMSNKWNDVMGGKYNIQPVAKAKGGALNSIAYLADGSGSGRDDTIHAKLSDGEYVIDAETVALLGDGSNKAGAKQLDQMRKEIRMQKGKKLVKGAISSNAKSPLNYLRGA
jgi:hypothetical protein